MGMITMEQFAISQGLTTGAMSQRARNYYGDKWPKRQRQGKYNVFDENEALKCIAENPYIKRQGHNQLGKKRKLKIKDQMWTFDKFYVNWLAGCPPGKAEAKAKIRSMASKINHDKPITTTDKIIGMFDE